MRITRVELILYLNIPYEVFCTTLRTISYVLERFQRKFAMLVEPTITDITTKRLVRYKVHPVLQQTMETASKLVHKWQRYPSSNCYTIDENMRFRFGPLLRRHLTPQRTRSSADADNRRDAFSGHSRSTNIVPFHILGIVSYCAIVTLSLRRAVFTIFDFKKCRDLEIGVRGHSLSLKVATFDRL